MKPFDVAIVGAGIVGSAVARECARHGWRVAIIEGGVPAGGATAAGMGHVVVMDDSPAQLALSAYSRSLWQQDLSAMPQSVEFEQCGTVWVAADGEEMAEVHGKQRVYREVGIDAQVLSAAELARSLCGQDRPGRRHCLRAAAWAADPKAQGASRHHG